MPNNLKISPKLETILEPDYTLSGFVKSSMSEFGPWLEVNNVKFFAEYTDHSLSHVEGVLETADKLIRENCRAIVTAGDVAVLILASFLHDCAMHLSVDGFRTLIRSDKVIDGFGDKSWSALWEDFIAESRRFSGRKLMSLFGDTEAIQPPRDLDSHNMTGKDLLLIGEFLRRHHHRLAHEIAVYGVPGPDGYQLKLPEKEETKHIAELAGVVARSHGLPIRACYDYLQGKFSSYKNFKGVHPVFLMALLRIADILQLQSSRVPRQVQMVRSLRSPVSQGEWEMHRAIKDINWTEYPETIFIHAEPPNAKTFLRIKDLLTQIQHEFDSSWTVMSEAYYPEESLRVLGLTIRRVRSNLDNEKEFAEKVNYIPCRAAFEVADTDLLKLLIGPLYGERPEIGIRELLQNSIDAVRERHAYLEKHPELKDVEFTEPEADVVVSIDEEEDGWWVTVSDRGIGMTLDTVRNYFLKAGASLRRSEIWRKTFEDEKGKSQVLRSGRFGVGVLAAYLLGHEVQVSTRYINEPQERGISFSAELDTEAIELQRANRPVGTTVRVRISNEVKDNLLGEWNEKTGKWRKQPKWDWYCLSDPKVLLMTYHGRRKLRQQYQLPPFNSDLPPDWHRITHPDYQDIQWTYSIAPNLTCNGIKVIYSKYTEKFDFFGMISNAMESYSRSYRMGAISMKRPNISVFDFDGNLPLNLQRTSLTLDEYSFENQLYLDIIKDFFAHGFANSPTNIDNDSLLKWCSWINYPGISSDLKTGRDDIYGFPWFFTKFGISFALDGWYTDQIDAKSALFAYIDDISRNICSDIFNKGSVLDSSQAVFLFGIRSDYFRLYSKYKHTEAEDYMKALVKAYNIEKMTQFSRLWRSFVSGKRIMFNRNVLARMARQGRIDMHSLDDPKKVLPSHLRSNAGEEFINESWVVLRIGKCPSSCFDFEKFAHENDDKDYSEYPYVLVEKYFKAPKPQLEESELSPLAKVWRDIVGTPIIPFDLEERRRMKAWKELKPYIEAHEKMKNISEVKG